MIGGSLFTGIAGLDMGLEIAGAVSSWAWQCEKDPHARAVLAHHYPSVRRYEDVREVDENAAQVDIICGGFPCQDISNAGKRAGIDGDRSGLWSEFARIIRVLRPRYVFVENVRALLARGVDRVLGDLANLGFDAEWEVFRASDVGAPHIRERVFILAHADRAGVRVESGGAMGRTGPIRPSLDALARNWPTPTASNGTSGPHSPASVRKRRTASGAGCMNLVDMVLWPTPCAADAGRASGTFARGNPTLTGAVKSWTTPTARDAKDSSGESHPERGGPSLPNVVREMWPTPTATDAKASGSAGYSTESGRHQGTTLTVATVRTASRRAPPRSPDGMVLNPRFVEAMMGFPDGHTDCAYLGTQSSSSKRPERG